MVDIETEILAHLLDYAGRENLVIVKPPTDNHPQIFCYKGRFVYMYLKPQSELDGMELSDMLWLQQAQAVGGCVQTVAEAICILDDVDRLL